MELSSVLTKVRALVEKAEHPATPKAEADLARATADRLMEKYAIEEWQAATKASGPTKPGRVKIDIGEGNSMFLTETATLVNVVANFCRCSSIWMKGSGRYGHQESCMVYGYESDLRYFEIMFTTLYLHMSGAIFPGPDPAETLGVNAYRMHNAGLNWFDIAQAYGWAEVPRKDGEPRYMYRNRETGERASWAKSVGRIKAAYTKEVIARGEQALRIPPSGTENFRRNAAKGYLARIAQRLHEQSGKRGSGTELVLSDRTQNVRQALAEDFPDTQMTGARFVKYNAEAYGRGVKHANSASLNPAATTASRKAL